MDLQSLNTKYESLHPKQRLEKLFEDFDQEKILVTTSLGSTSVILLHLLSEVKPGHPVYFIDTSYHFKETLEYKKLIQDGFKLNIIDLKADDKKNRFTRENKTWKYNHELCCFINKIDPLEKIKPNYDIWVSGLLAFQNLNRNDLNIFEQNGLMKFHPIIDMSKQDVALQIQLYDLPIHSLVHKGYDSIGCTHCTNKGQGRVGRWMDFAKTECGLHL
ncbi:MAG: phosphoadenylyl-sulfate reductase [Bacteroidetes bacterium]|nr:phosphoadenylyl-sulfate reductase [Bacteroidota bacterium]